MRHIILEGPDGTGKSTLASQLSRTFGIPIQHSGGPEKEPGEINVRTRKYLAYTQRHIFDRHPCVSQEIYKKIRNTNNGSVDPQLIAAFYLQRPILIYCRPHLVHEISSKHVAKEGLYDTPQHLKEITENFSQLVTMYDVWGLERAHYIYRIGEGYPNVWADIVHQSVR